jgi:PTH2 family peptidyl-tRNA hydrolase
MTIKQVIVLRTDLNMRKGKMAAQAAHASMKVFFDQMLPRNPNTPTLLQIDLDRSAEAWEWVEGLFTKIVVGIESEELLKAMHTEVLLAGLPCAIIEDAGATEFHGQPTLTALAIGPAKAEDIDPFTKDLKLL